MGKKILVKYLAILGGSICLAHYFGQIVSMQAKQRNPLLVPPENIEHFAFGYADTLADSFWLRTIQDFEYCGSSASGLHLDLDKLKNESQSDSYQGSQSQTPLKPARCEKGWAFRMLNEITDLSPKFEIIYTMAAPGLSIVVDDREGAEILFDKGIQALPEIWQIPYMAGYHALYETQKLDKAARLLHLAGQLGAPEWVYFLATRISTRVGMAEFGKKVITEYIERFPPDEVPERARQRLREVEAVLKEERQ